MTKKTVRRHRITVPRCLFLGFVLNSVHKWVTGKIDSRECFAFKSCHVLWFIRLNYVRNTFEKVNLKKEKTVALVVVTKKCWFILTMDDRSRQVKKIPVWEHRCCQGQLKWTTSFFFHASGGEKANSSYSCSRERKHTYVISLDLEGLQRSCTQNELILVIKYHHYDYLLLL